MMLNFRRCDMMDVSKDFREKSRQKLRIQMGQAEGHLTERFFFLKFSSELY